MAQAPPWKQLHSPEAVATSSLKSNRNRFEENYHPNYVFDGDPKTAWVEGVEGQGEGSTVTLPVSVLSSARAVQLRVRNASYNQSHARTATLQTGRHFLQYDAQGRLITSW